MAARRADRAGALDVRPCLLSILGVSRYALARVPPLVRNVFLYRLRGDLLSPKRSLPNVSALV